MDPRSVLAKVQALRAFDGKGRRPGSLRGDPSRSFGESESTFGWALWMTWTKAARHSRHSRSTTVRVRTTSRWMTWTKAAWRSRHSRSAPVRVRTTSRWMTWTKAARHSRHSRSAPVRVRTTSRWMTWTKAAWHSQHSRSATVRVRTTSRWMTWTKAARRSRHSRSATVLVRATSRQDGGRGGSCFSSSCWPRFRSCSRSCFSYPHQPCYGLASSHGLLAREVNGPTQPSRVHVSQSAHPTLRSGSLNGHEGSPIPPPCPLTRCSRQHRPVSQDARPGPSISK